jgi:HPt (histidine-containing phosphotransfer) domain-containing protein
MLSESESARWHSARGRSDSRCLLCVKDLSHGTLFYKGDTTRFALCALRFSHDALHTTLCTRRLHQQPADDINRSYCKDCAQKSGLNSLNLTLPPALLSSPFNQPEERRKALEKPIPSETINLITLRESCGSDLNFALELFNLYQETSTQTLEDLQGAISSADVENSVLHAHDLKGSSGSMGAERVRWVCERMEIYAREQNLELAHQLIPELLEELQKFYAAFKQMLEKQ